MGKPREIDLDEQRKSRGSTLDVRGATLERLMLASGSVSVGDDRMGGKVYRMMDSPLDGLYLRLVKAARTEDKIDRLRAEYAALDKYHRLFVESGLVGSIGSVDPNRTYSPTPFGRDFCGKTEKQCDQRDEFRRAVICLNNHEKWGHKQTIVVDNVVCAGLSLKIAGWSVGKESAGWAHEFAERVLRDAGWRLHVMWEKKGKPISIRRAA